MRLITSFAKRTVERARLEVERARIGNKRSLLFAIVIALATLIAAFCALDASADAVLGNRRNGFLVEGMA